MNFDIKSFDPEGILFRRVVSSAEGRVEINTGQQYGAAEILEKTGVIRIENYRGRRFAVYAEPRSDGGNC